MEPNFIPPVANRRAVSSLPVKIIWVVVGAVVLGIIGTALLFMSRTPNPVDEITRLESQMQSLIDMTTEGRKSAKNPDLSKTTIDISLVLPSDLDTIIEASGGKNPKPDSAIVAQEKAISKEDLEKLKTASINGRFDQTYIPLLIERLNAAKDQLNVVNRKTARPELKSATLATYNHIDGFIRTLSEISL